MLRAPVSVTSARSNADCNLICGGVGADPTGGARHTLTRGLIVEWCNECGKELDGGISHMFSGYGFHIRFCESCCPRTYDGTDCDDKHEREESEKDKSNLAE